MKTNYAKEKLECLLRDINNYNADEFRRQMIRIVNGACGHIISDDCHLYEKERDQLKAQVEQLRELLIRVVKSEEYILDCGLIVAVSSDLVSEISEAIDAAPSQCLAEIKAQAVEEYYYMGWEHSLSTKSEDGDHYSCGRRLAKEFADAIRQTAKADTNG